MIHRLVFYSLLRPFANEEFSRKVIEETEDIIADWKSYGISEASIFVFDPYVCVYAEASNTKTSWDWPESFKELLEIWPTEPGNIDNKSSIRLTMPMMDIFHDGVPMDSSTWRDNRQVEKRIGSIARLKPEQVASYIFYHYQLQEEQPESFNKSYIIGIFSRLLFSYYELPEAVSEVKLHGLLSTKQTPDNWQEVMNPHFDQWETDNVDEQLWQRMECILNMP